jgi:hypothetical protein
LHIYNHTFMEKKQNNITRKPQNMLQKKLWKHITRKKHDGEDMVMLTLCKCGFIGVDNVMNK